MIAVECHERAGMHTNDKKRLARAIRRAADVLTHSDYRVTILRQDGVFSLEAMRKREIRKIRVVLDEILEPEERQVRACRLPDVCTKEIWCKRLNDQDFLIREIR